ncbi:MAG TPA: gephyrin-like molybdotransferase Glp [Rhodanobacteraceae bacterium]|nr:gephyrin-like molybdotransferase Glp [Rhodanobacteraceae bacterium]
MSSAPAIEIPTRLSVDEARERVVELCGQRRVAVDEIALDRALGRVLAVDVAAPHALPPFANSAMDGYALRGEDLPREGEKRFRMAGVMLAGGGEALRVGADDCIRITTGAPLPIGADTVVIKERVRVDDGFVVVTSGESKAANVRLAGEDLAAGETAACAGEVLSAARLGLLASCGFAKVPVARRPRVALLVTGDELVPTGEPLGFGQIHDSNRYTLAGLLEDIGIVPHPVAHVRDDVLALRETLLAVAATCDVVISSGGVSAGEADHIPGLVAELGRVHFWKVRMKPGMPVLCGEIGKALVFALPGNPVSSLATFLTLVKPGLMAMQGADETRRRWYARLRRPIRKKHDRTEFLRARVECGEDGQLHVSPVEQQGSGMLRGVAEANCFIVFAEGVHELAERDIVEVIPLPGLC